MGVSSSHTTNPCLFPIIPFPTAQLFGVQAAKGELGPFYQQKATCKLLSSVGKDSG